MNKIKFEKIKQKNFRIWFIFSFVSVIFLTLDLMSKFFAIKFIEKPIILIPNVLRLELVFNKGVSFSMLENLQFFPYLFALLGTIVIFYLLVKYKTNFILLGILFGSLLGNFFDRLFSPIHAVTDFIGYFNWFIGNIADIFIVLSVSILAIKYLISSNIAKKK